MCACHTELRCCWSWKRRSALPLVHGSSPSDRRSWKPLLPGLRSGLTPVPLLLWRIRPGHVFHNISVAKGCAQCVNVAFSAVSPQCNTLHPEIWRCLCSDVIHISSEILCDITLGSTSFPITHCLPFYAHCVSKHEPFRSMPGRFLRNVRPLYHVYLCLFGPGACLSLLSASVWCIMQDGNKRAIKR